MQRGATVAVARIDVGFAGDQLFNRRYVATMCRSVQARVARDFGRVGRDLRLCGRNVVCETDDGSECEQYEAQVHGDFVRLYLS